MSVRYVPMALSVLVGGYILLVGSLGLIVPDIESSLAGLAVLFAVFYHQRWPVFTGSAKPPVLARD